MLTHLELPFASGFTNLHPVVDGIPILCFSDQWPQIVSPCHDSKGLKILSAVSVHLLIAEEANGQPQNEALKERDELPWVKRNHQTGIGPVQLVGLKIESAPL
jgi:hypothetical protein